MTYTITLEYDDDLQPSDADWVRESLTQLKEMLSPQPRMMYVALGERAADVVAAITAGLDVEGP